MERKPFFKLKKGHNSQINWWILPKIELDLHFIIHLCIKFVPKFVPNLFKRYRTETIFIS